MSEKSELKTAIEIVKELIAIPSRSSDLSLAGLSYRLIPGVTLAMQRYAAQFKHTTDVKAEEIKTAQAFYQSNYGFNSILTHRLIYEAMETYATNKESDRVKLLERALKEINNLSTGDLNINIAQRIAFNALNPIDK